MATMNLLKGSFNGKVGEIVGVETENKCIIKKKSFKTPHPTKLQTKNVRAFECLNRLAASLARLDSGEFPVSTESMALHNAIASYLKIIISNHTFEPELASSILLPDGYIKIVDFTLDQAKESVHIQLTGSSNAHPLRGEQVFSLVFNQVGKIYSEKKSINFDLDYEATVKTGPNERFFLWGFVATPQKKGFFLHGFFYQEATRMLKSVFLLQGQSFPANTWTQVKLIPSSLVGDAPVEVSNNNILFKKKGVYLIQPPHLRKSSSSQITTRSEIAIKDSSGTQIYWSDNCNSPPNSTTSGFMLPSFQFIIDKDGMAAQFLFNPSSQITLNTPTAVDVPGSILFLG